MSTGILNDLITYIDSNSTRLAVGRTIFAGALPDATLNSQASSTGPQVAVVPVNGQSPIRRFVPAAGGSPAFLRPAYRVIVRSTAGAGAQPDGARSWSIANEVHDLLEQFPPNSTVAGGVYGTINSIDTVATPGFEDRDEDGRWIWTFSVNVTA